MNNGIAWYSKWMCMKRKRGINILVLGMYLNKIKNIFICRIFKNASFYQTTNVV